MNAIGENAEVKLFSALKDPSSELLGLDRHDSVVLDELSHLGASSEISTMTPMSVKPAPGGSPVNCLEWQQLSFGHILRMATQAAYLQG